jgi:hypothetical protein
MKRALLALSLAGCVDAGSSGPCASGLTPIGVANETVTDNVLRFDVSYSGGCKTHEFAVWPNGFFGDSPSVVQLEIHHYDRGDSCEALQTHPLYIDLSSIPGDGATIEIQQRGADVPARFGSVQWTRSPVTTFPVGEQVLSIDESCVGH